MNTPSPSRSLTSKSGYDNYKLWSPQPDPATIARCPVCNSTGEVWQYAKAPEEQLQRVVMCTRGEAFGPQDGLVNEGCLLYMPPDGFYRATTKEAVRYWNDYAKALLAVRSEKPALQPIRGVGIEGGYVIVTPVGAGTEPPRRLREQILELFPVEKRPTASPYDLTGAKEYPGE